MKKLILMVAVAVAMSLAGCESGSKYAEQGKQMAEQLDKAVEMQDTAAALAADKAIHEAEQEILALNDTAALNQFRQAISASLQRNSPYLTAIKVKNGAKDSIAVGDVVDDVMSGKVDIGALTSSIDTLLNDKGK